MVDSSFASRVAVLADAQVCHNIHRLCTKCCTCTCCTCTCCCISTLLREISEGPVAAHTEPGDAFPPCIDA